MLQTGFIRENKELIIERLAKRNMDGSSIVEQIIKLDDKRKETQQKLDDNLALGNKLSKQIGDLFKKGMRQEADELKTRTSEIKENINFLKEEQQTIIDELKALLYQLPNIPDETVPSGNCDADNVLIYEEGVKPNLKGDALPHWDLAKKYGLIDFELGVKVTGSGFPFYIGEGARLQRGLINFFLDQACSNGYKEVVPPLLVNEESGIGTGQLPDKDGQMYHTKADDFYLIPTAEVPLTNMYRDVIVKREDLPIKLAGYTPCFRREAGSYGKDVRGLNRLHQFDKVEIIQIQDPKDSVETLEVMVEQVKVLLEKLSLPYRLVKLCGGDLGFAASITYDFEVYSAAQKKWLEVSSVSNFESFQANRLKCRFKDEDGKTKLVHTLNGSALALPRIMATLLENNQTDEAIRIPKVLVPYTGFDTIKLKS